MAKKQALPAACQKLVEQVAGKVLDLTYGQGGSPSHGTRFEEVEEAGVQVGDALARAVMQQAVERQATTVPAERCSCGRPLEPCIPKHARCPPEGARSGGTNRAVTARCTGGEQQQGCPEGNLSSKRLRQRL